MRKITKSHFFLALTILAFSAFFAKAQTSLNYEVVNPYIEISKPNSGETLAGDKITIEAQTYGIINARIILKSADTSFKKEYLFENLKLQDSFSKDIDTNYFLEGYYEITAIGENQDTNVEGNSVSFYFRVPALDTTNESSDLLTSREEDFSDPVEKNTSIDLTQEKEGIEEDKDNNEEEEEVEEEVVIERGRADVIEADRETFPYTVGIGGVTPELERAVFNNNISILSPNDGTRITRGRLRLLAKADEFESLRFYVKKKDSLDIFYRKNADKLKDGLWVAAIEIKDRLPDGEYFVSAVSQKEGIAYKTGEHNFTVNFVQIKSSDFTDFNKETDKDGDGISDKKESELGTDVEKVDSDGDGLSDRDEIRIGTDPNSPDTDGDGFSDGEEIRNKHNPLVYSPEGKDRVIFESVRDRNEISSDYTVERVNYSYENDENISKKALALEGRGLPNSFGSLYVYSDNPIIILVRTDSEGNWRYELKKELENGEHEAYFAVTDADGSVLERSNPLNFIKTAEAVTVTPRSLAATQSPVEKSKYNLLGFALVAIMFFFGIGIIIIGFMVNYRNKT